MVYMSDYMSLSHAARPNHTLELSEVIIPEGFREGGAEISRFAEISAFLHIPNASDLLLHLLLDELS